MGVREPAVRVRTLLDASRARPAGGPSRGDSYGWSRQRARARTADHGATGAASLSGRSRNRAAGSPKQARTGSPGQAPRDRATANGGIPLGRPRSLRHHAAAAATPHVRCRHAHLLGGRRCAPRGSGHDGGGPGPPPRVSVGRRSHRVRPTTVHAGPEGRAHHGLRRYRATSAARSCSRAARIHARAGRDHTAGRRPFEPWRVDVFMFLRALAPPSGFRSML
jgi:hypothetical protein